MNEEIDWQRAKPSELAKFDSSTKVCVMNCGKHAHDPRSDKELKFLCDDCEIENPPATP